MGWRREGLLGPIYALLAEEGFSDARDELARRTGIPSTNLSAINSGRRDMTVGYARRIADAVGISPVELGAPEDKDDPSSQGVLDRLARLEAQICEIEDDRRQAVEGAVRQLVEIRAVLAQVAPGSVPASWVSDDE